MLQKRISTSSPLIREAQAGVRALNNMYGLKGDEAFEVPDNNQLEQIEHAIWGSSLIHRELRADMLDRELYTDLELGSRVGEWMILDSCAIRALGIAEGATLLSKTLLARMLEVPVQPELKLVQGEG